MSILNDILKIYYISNTHRIIQDGVTSTRLNESWIVGFSVEGWSILCAGKGMAPLMTNGYLQGMFLEQGDLLQSFTNGIQRLLNAFQLLYVYATLPFQPLQNFTKPPIRGLFDWKKRRYLTRDPRLQNKGRQT